MGPGRLGLKFGMELNGQEPGVVAQLDDLDNDAVGTGARRDQAVLLKRLAVFIVKLVAMAMALD